MGEEQQFVEQARPEQLRRQRGATHSDAALGAGAYGGELLDRVVTADDPGVVFRTVASARNEHLGLGRPDLAVLAQDVGQRLVPRAPAASTPP